MEMNELRTTGRTVRCPGCGRQLSADPAWPSAACPFCGCSFPLDAGPAEEAPQRRAGRARPPRKRHTFRWLLLCALFFFLGRALLPGLTAGSRGSGAGGSRSLSAPAAAASPRPSATPRPTAAPRPAASPKPASAPPQEGVTPEFKRYMDSYEEFFDEYIAFMQSLDEEEEGLGFLLKYAAMMERYAEVMDSLDAVDEEALSTADEIYYLEVLSRINRKLLNASED